MKIKNESDLRSKVLATLRKAGATCFAIESEQVPDAYISNADGSAWIEFKIGKVRSQRVVCEFRPGQIATLRALAANNENAFVGVYLPEDDALYFFRKKYAEEYAYPVTEYNIKINALGSGEALLRALTCK